MQLTEFFGALTEQFDGADIMEGVRYSPVLVFRSIPSLRLRFRARQPAPA